MIRERDLKSYRKSQDIYRHYIERDKANPTKEKCKRMMEYPNFMAYFKSEQAMWAQTRKFREKKHVAHRDYDIQQKILIFYNSI